MTIAVVNAPSSTLADVIGQVMDSFAGVGDATPIMIGKQYLDRGVGATGARVVFLPEPKGKMAPAITANNAASIYHSCGVLVRGEESGDDVGRFRAAYALGDRVISALKRAATGRIDFTDFADKSPSAVDAFGADLAFAFVYRRDVRNDAKIWALPAATADGSGRVPLVPPSPGPGSEGTIEALTPTTTVLNGA